MSFIELRQPDMNTGRLKLGDRLGTNVKQLLFSWLQAKRAPLN